MKSLIIILAFSLAACSSMHYSSVTSSHLDVVLERPVQARVKMPLGNYAALKLSAGRYKPAFEDSKGVYYSSPAVTIWAVPPIGDSVVTGGLFAPAGSSDVSQLRGWAKTTFETIQLHEFVSLLNSSRDGVSFGRP